MHLSTHQTSTGYRTTVMGYDAEGCWHSVEFTTSTPEESERMARSFVERVGVAEPILY